MHLEVGVVVVDVGVIAEEEEAVVKTLAVVHLLWTDFVRVAGTSSRVKFGKKRVRSTFLYCKPKDQSPITLNVLIFY